MQAIRKTSYHCLGGLIALFAIAQAMAIVPIANANGAMGLLYIHPITRAISLTEPNTRTVRDRASFLSGRFMYPAARQEPRPCISTLHLLLELKAF